MNNRVIKFRAFYEGVWYYQTLEEMLTITLAAFRLGEHKTQFTGLLDKNGKEIYEGDIVIGLRGALPTDGRLRKGMPKTVRVFLKVVFGNGRDSKAGVSLNEIGFHQEDIEARKFNQYRAINYELRESREFFLNEDGSVPWLGRCNSLEIIGNIFENPELINK